MNKPKPIEIILDIFRQVRTFTADGNGGYWAATNETGAHVKGGSGFHLASGLKTLQQAQDIARSWINAPGDAEAVWGANPPRGRVGRPIGGVTRDHLNTLRWRVILYSSSATPLFVHRSIAVAFLFDSIRGVRHGG